MTVSLFTDRPLGNYNPFLSFVHFAGFYVSGIYFSAYFEHIKRLNIMNQSIVGGLLLFGCAVALNLHAPAEQSFGFVDGLGKFSVSLLGKLSLLVAVIFLLERFVNVQNRFLGWMAEISFGLFFLHGFFMIAFMRLKERITLGSPLLMLAIELVFVLGGSMLAVVMVKRIIGKRSRYVIGC